MKDFDIEDPPHVKHERATLHDIQAQLFIYTVLVVIHTTIVVVVDHINQITPGLDINKHA